MKTIISILILFTSCISFLFGQTHTISSPDEHIQLIVSNENGNIMWSVSRKGQAIISPSRTGFMLSDSIELQSNFKITQTETTSFEEIWTTVWGPDRYINNQYNSLLCHTVHEPEDIVVIYEFRVFNDGLGFRYILPKQDNLDNIVIIDELTEFSFSHNHQTWWIVADFNCYEKLYNNTLLSEVNWANTPMTLRTESGIHISIHEAQLFDYSEMTLKKQQGKDFSFVSALAPWHDGTKVKTSTPMQSPWRTVQISESATDLVESHLIVNLNEPCKIEDISWIRPMKYIGIWWGFHIGTHTWSEGERQGATTARAFEYIDFASKHNIQGVVVEGWNKGWDKWGERGAFDQITPANGYDLKAVAEYARKKGVYLIMHHETGGDAEGYEQLMEEAYAMCSDLGIHALKTGYAGGIYPRGEHHHGQYMVRHYQKVVETAARYKLMLNVHEPIKPTGLYRTWPNMMTREGVRGMEWNAWSEGNSPSHTMVLPYTRMLAGPLDYTPAIFDILIENTQNERVAWNFNIDDITKTRIHTTLLHQIALFFILYSPMQMASDDINNYTNHPAFSAIADAPTDWEKTLVLRGEVGEYITIARYGNSEWWIAAATNEEEREITIDLSFLDENKSYHFVHYADDEDSHYVTNPLEYQILKGTIRKDDTFTFKCAPGGGGVVRIFIQQ